jgi:dihydropteroate synthase
VVVLHRFLLSQPQRLRERYRAVDQEKTRLATSFCFMVKNFSQPIAPFWKTSRFEWTLNFPQVLGIVNVTPDSFSDGGHWLGVGATLAHCEQLIRDGAHGLDIGGESSRPGAIPVPLDVELARVCPVVRAAVSLGVPISVDTYKPEVMRAVLDLGVDVINDIWALRMPGALKVIAAHPRCGVCLMHMHRDPLTMQLEPLNGDVVDVVRAFLAERCHVVIAAGVEANRIVVDPGIGFGKTRLDNYRLLNQQHELLSLGFPVLAGWSRKSSLEFSKPEDHGDGLLPVDRLIPSVAAALLAVERGARIVRVHDVKPTVDALKVWVTMCESSAVAA